MYLIMLSFIHFNFDMCIALYQYMHVYKKKQKTINFISVKQS